MRRTTKIIMAITMVMMLVAAIIFIGNIVVTILTTSKTLLEGGVVNSPNDVSEFFMRQSGTIKIILLLLAELAIPASIVGIIGSIMGMAKMVAPEYDQISIEEE